MRSASGLGGDVLYRKPPLVETSLGVGFEPIPGWNVQHFGLYQHEVRERYPTFDTANPIVLGRPGLNMSIFVPAQKVRAFYSNEERTRLIQMQNDLFFLNWQKMANETSYPRYHKLKAAFLDEWRAYGEFLDGNKLARPTVSRQQISYINVIDRARMGNGFLEIDDVFAAWRSSQGTISAARRDVTMSATYQIDDVELTYVLQSAIRLADSQPVFQFTLTSSTMRNVVDVDASLMDHLHAVLIEAFEEFTSQRAKEFWGKVQ